MRSVWVSGLGGISAVAAFMACQAGSTSRATGGNANGAGGNGTGNSNSLSLPTGSGGTLNVDTGSGGGASLETCSGQCTDFPSAAVLDSSSPPGDTSAFNGTGTGPAPCLIEPVAGTLVPNNWLPPYVRWSAPGATTVEITFSAPNQANPLTVYTSSQTGYTMDAKIWANVRKHSWGFNNPITVSVRALVNGTLTAAATGSLTVATVDADGTIVYWATAGNVDAWKAGAPTVNNSSKLEGFYFGELGFTPVLEPTQVQEKVLGTDGTSNPPWGTPVSVMCIGCHVSTPDGQYAAFIGQFADPIAIASIQADGGVPIGATPPWLTSAAQTFLMGWPTPAQNPWGIGGNGDVNAAGYGMGTPAFSPAAWSSTQKIMVTSKGNDLAKWASLQTNIPAELYWVDLLATSAATAGGMITRTGDTRSAAVPSWSHDGKTILYTSTNVKNSERLGFNGNTGPEYNNNPSNGTVVSITPIADLYTVPFDANAKTGGAATPVPGASSPTVSEYYGSFSADDLMIAYNAVPTSVAPQAGAAGQVSGELYNQPAAEVFVIPAAGGTGIRLAANDPAACYGKSPGVNNSWPKWSPNVTDDPTTSGRTFYWLLFSSARDGALAQLYLAGVTKEPDGSYKTYPGALIWNQDPDTSNRTPAWDNFQIAAATTATIR